MGKQSEYRRMMRALEDLDRVDAGKPPRRGLRPEVRSTTERWVHGNTAKVASAYAKGTDHVVTPLRRPRPRRTVWVIVLLVVLLTAVAVAAIPAARHVVARGLASATAVPHRLLPAVQATTRGPHAFEHMTGPNNGVPVTYDPCLPIRYTINSDLAPTDSTGIIGEAVGEISRLTGLSFEYVGVSHDPVRWQQKVAPSVLVGVYPPVEIAWAKDSEFTALKGDVLGFGGSTYLSGTGVESRYVTGSVALRAAQLGQILRTTGGRSFVKAVVLHELGHVVGLAHVHDTKELMNPEIVRQSDFGPGDRQGLALLGQGSCHT